MTRPIKPNTTPTWWTDWWPQLVRIEPGNNGVEEAHMRNRQLISWVFEKGAADKVVEMVKKNGKTYIVVNDYEKLRELFGRLLPKCSVSSLLRFVAARDLVETHAVKVDPVLHAEVLNATRSWNLC